ncbi:transient receptor potential channel pyrexia-like [Macrobrachium nipponense]|uniref:transient receptor potential channel pyrexia-like n=1 Tax=Macrobrachium nipponense TaxID=159736 RepID=UPI0030C89265
MVMTQLHYENEGYVEDTETGGDSEILRVENRDSHSFQGSSKLARQGTASRLVTAIQKGNTEDVQNILDQAPECISSSDGGLSPLHLSCHAKQLDILVLLIERGAKMTLPDNQGNSVLHTAVREKWYDGMRELLRRGASPDEMSHPPENNGDDKETPLHTAVKMFDYTSIKLLMEYRPNMSIRDGSNNTVFHIAASKNNLKILQELVEDEDFEKYIELAESDGYTIFHAALSGGAGAHNEPSVLKLIRFIYRYHNNLDQPNVFGETPLIKACRLGLSKIVNFFLNNGANPRQVTHTGESVIHAACSSGCAKTLNHLLSTKLVGDLITSPDRNGSPPFHYAVDSSSLECCKTLLENGEHLTAVYKNGKSNCALAIERLPFAMEFLKALFDSGIMLSDKSVHHQNFKVTFDYSVLMCSGKFQCSVISELVGTPLEPLIKHPLLDSFLNIRWYHIRKLYYTNVLWFFIYLLFHTCFIMITFGPEPKDWEADHTSLVLYKTFHAIFIILIAVPGCLLLFANFKKYLLQLETYTRVTFLLISATIVFLVSGKIEDYVERGDENETAPSTEGKCDEDETTLSTARMLASMSVVLGWAELMMLLGRFPTLGSYVLMFSKVGKSIIKFLLAFVSILIGFSLGFHIIYQKLNVFGDYKISFVKTLTMMTGGLLYKEFVDTKGSPVGVYCLIFLSMFLFMVTIIMSNLLIGLAVNDIPELKRQGKIRRLVKQASYLIAFEKLLSITGNIRVFPKKLYSFLQSQYCAESSLSVFPNNEFRKHRYFQTVPAAVIKEAIALGTCGSKEDFPMDDDADIVDQLKSFRIRYFSDYKNQKSEFSDISKICLSIQKQLDTMRNATDSQISRLSAQLDKQSQNYQNVLNHITQKSILNPSDI